MIKSIKNQNSTLIKNEANQQHQFTSETCDVIVNESPESKKSSKQKSHFFTQCFTYYITNLREEGDSLEQYYYNIQPRWMEDFGELRIGDLMIPGTHNSGTYKTVVPRILSRFVLNQDRSIWDQLMYGIRYFDIRVGIYRNTPEKLFINHDFLRCAPLIPELKSIATFLQQYPKEVIILDIHRFPYPKSFSKQDHIYLLEKIWRVLGKLIYPYNNEIDKGPKLQDLWRRGKRIIICYADTEIIPTVSWLWPPICRKWANTDEIKVLKEYIQYYTVKPPKGNPMWVLMAELTPTPYYVALHPNRSLKYLADLINNDLTDWMREMEENNTNIVATDFFTGTDIVSYAIQNNLRRLKKL